MSEELIKIIDVKIENIEEMLKVYSFHLDQAVENDDDDKICHYSDIVFRLNSHLNDLYVINRLIKCEVSKNEK